MSGGVFTNVLFHSNQLFLFIHLLKGFISMILQVNIIFIGLDWTLFSWNEVKFQTFDSDRLQTLEWSIRILEGCF